MNFQINAGDRRRLLAGALAGIIFCGVATFGILTRPGFDLQRHAVSSLSLGEGGWTMTAAFLVSGILTLLCAQGVSRVLKIGRGRSALPVLIGLYGLGLIIAGSFPAPVCCGFPPGTAQDQLPVMTAGAIIHSIAFMVAFAALILASFVAALRLSGSASLFSFLAGSLMPLLVALSMGTAIPPGVAFFIAAVIGWAWLAGFVTRLAGASVQPGAQPGAQAPAGQS